MSTLVIGDIHGCFDELRALLDLAGIGNGDRVIAVGDVVDRGPLSKDVIEFFMSTRSAMSIMGNHERKHVRAARGELSPALSQVISREQIGDGAYESAVEFMGGFPAYVELDDAIVTHAFLEPGVELPDQQESVLAGTMSGARRMRGYLRPWYEMYEATSRSSSVTRTSARAEDPSSFGTASTASTPTAFEEGA